MCPDECGNLFAAVSAIFTIFMLPHQQPFLVLICICIFIWVAMEKFSNMQTAHQATMKPISL